MTTAASATDSARLRPSRAAPAFQPLPAPDSIYRSAPLRRPLCRRRCTFITLVPLRSAPTVVPLRTARPQGLQLQQQGRRCSPQRTRFGSARHCLPTTSGDKANPTRTVTLLAVALATLPATAASRRPLKCRLRPPRRYLPPTANFISSQPTSFVRRPCRLRAARQLRRRHRRSPRHYMCMALAMTPRRRCARTS